MNEYEKTQNFNFITKGLHLTRYRNLEKIIIKISKKNPKLKVVDVGCGLAKTYEVISALGIGFNYVGIEIKKYCAELANERYGKNDNFTYINKSVENAYDEFNDADIVIGLESFEHIPESIVVKTIEAIGESNCKYIYLTVPNEIGPAIFIKNIGSFLMGYKRYKEYSWQETFSASIYNLDRVERHGTGHKGFDWRWLAHTLRQNCKILRYTSSPFNFIPKFISPSIGFVCQNDKHTEDI